jgi:hypothetical protein
MSESNFLPKKYASVFKNGNLKLINSLKELKNTCLLLLDMYLKYILLIHFHIVVVLLLLLVE